MEFPMRRGLQSALIAGLALAGLSACTPKITTVSQTSRSVVVQYAPADGRAAAKQAASLCGDYGRAAQLRSLHDQWDTMKQTAVYDCVGGV
jgi:hypothetical protein